MRAKVRNAYFLIFTGYIFMWLFLFSVSYKSNSITIIVCALFSIISICCGWRKLIKQKRIYKVVFSWQNFIQNTKKLIGENWLYVIVLFVASILYYLQSYHVHPKWDNNLYYNIIASNNIHTLFDIKTISVTTYLRTAFCLPIFALKCLVRDGIIAMTVAGYIVYMIAGIYFYRIVNLLFPSVNKITRILLSSLFLVNPFVLGMSTSVNWDYFSLCLILPVYFHYIKKEYIKHIMWVSLFLFTKEVNILVYFGMVLGFLWKDLRNGVKLKDILLGYRYYGIIFLMGNTALVAICGLLIVENVRTIYVVQITYLGVCYLIWEIFHREKICTYLENHDQQFKILFVILLVAVGTFGSIYAGTFFNKGAFLWNYEFVTEKLKVLYLLNYNWILSLLALVGFVLSWKKNSFLEALVPLLFSDAIFVLFSILFQTYNHPRYIDIHLTYLCLFSVFSIVQMSRTYVMNLITIVMLVTMLGQNYKSMDPVTNGVFPHIEYGNRDIITTSYEEPISDSAVYNVEWTYFDKALNLALEDAVLRNGTICFPHWKFYFSGYDHPTGIEYWDPKRKMRFVESGVDYIPFDMIIKQDELSWEDMTKGKDCYYFYTSYYGAEEKDILESDGVVIEDIPFQYKNCVIHRVHFCYE